MCQGVGGSAASSTSVSDVDNSLDSPSVNDETPTYKSELLSLAEITPIFTKSRNRSNFAALLVKRLFDMPTRMRSNVSGRGKEKLDPEIIAYIKAKAFEYYKCNASEVKNQWAKCVTAIDDKSRALKRLKSSVKTEN